MLKEALSTMTTVFPPAVLQRGLEYQQKGHVLSVRLSDGLLKARVKGQSNQIYDVHVDLKKWPSEPSRCSCNYHSNCKHAVASFLAMQTKESANFMNQSIEQINPELIDWLAKLNLKKEGLAVVKEQTQQICYLLKGIFDGYQHVVVVTITVAKLLKRGGLGKKTPLRSLSETRKSQFLDKDEEIIASLLFKGGYAESWFEPIAIRNSELLEKILSTGRAFWEDEEEFPCRLGESRQAMPAWHMNNQGLQEMTFFPDTENMIPILLDKAWYVDVDAMQWGELHAEYTIKELETLLAAPPISLEDAPIMITRLESLGHLWPLPKIYSDREVRQITPVPVIYFDAFELGNHRYPWLSRNPDSKDAGNLHYLFTFHLVFDYEGIEISLDDARRVIIKPKGDNVVELTRDVDFERQQVEAIAAIIKVRPLTELEAYRVCGDISHELLMADIREESDLPLIYRQYAPALSEMGWRVVFNHSLYEDIIDADSLEWYSELNEGGNQFFSYQLGIMIEGKAVSIVPLVADLIQRLSLSQLDSLPDDELVKLPLENGKVLQVALGRIKPLVRLIFQFGARAVDEHQAIKMSRYELLLLKEMESAALATQMRWQAGDKIFNQLQQLLDKPTLTPSPLPKGLETTLRDYQHQGLTWLQFLREAGLSGVLADDMGLGKTVQTLAHLVLEKEQGRMDKASLIIAPTSLVVNWFNEAARFTPALKVLIFHGIERHMDNFDDYDLIISTYGLLQRDKERFLEYSFYYLILDEAQSIKNARTKTTQIAQQIKAQHRLCLSGTPIENHLGELWSLFHFLIPGLLGDSRQFKTLFKTPIEKEGSQERRRLLAGRVQPFMLRRSKNEVAKELPPKTEVVRTIELVGAQRDLYEAIRMSMEKKVRDAIAKQGMNRSHIVLLDALLKLRQVCCDPRLLSLPEASIAHGTSAKLEAFLEIIDNLMEEGRRVLVFSQFTSMLKLIEESLQARHFAYLKLTGQTQNRQALVDRFQQGEVPIFLISLKAGGTGLNLTKADTVIHYDPWWNPAVEDQATDRTHRIGQENPVFVYKLISSGTVEEAILMMQNKKRELFDGILSDNAQGLMTLKQDDLEQFFRPLETER